MILIVEKNTSTYSHVVIKLLLSIVKKEAKRQREKFKTRRKMVGNPTTTKSKNLKLYMNVNDECLMLNVSLKNVINAFRTLSYRKWCQKLKSMGKFQKMLPKFPFQRYL